MSLSLEQPGLTVRSDAKRFQDALESILTWLLEAQDMLLKQDEVSTNVQIVKDQFQEHEVNVPPCDSNLTL